MLIDLKKVFTEVVIGEDRLVQLLDEYGRLSDKARDLSTKLKPINKRVKELQKILGPIIAELEDQMAQTDAYVVAIKRIPYEKKTVAWKSIVEVLMTKVNAATKKVILSIIAESSKVVQVAAEIGVEKKESVDAAPIVIEGVLWDKLMQVISTLSTKVREWKQGIQEMRRAAEALDKALKHGIM